MIDIRAPTLALISLLFFSPVSATDTAIFPDRQTYQAEIESKFKPEIDNYLIYLSGAAAFALSVRGLLS